MKKRFRENDLQLLKLDAFMQLVCIILMSANVIAAVVLALFLRSWIPICIFGGIAIFIFFIYMFWGAVVVYLMDVKYMRNKMYEQCDLDANGCVSCEQEEIANRNQ